MGSLFAVKIWGSIYRDDLAGATQEVQKLVIRNLEGRGEGERGRCGSFFIMVTLSL